jgi:uncharacterized NAD(P)/FAD-binding protein YdhS
MVDYVLALLLGGHQGPIIAMSRRGLLPRSHRHVELRQIEAADLPSNTNFTALFRWVRQLSKAEMARGGDWRSTIDGLRPFSHQIWRGLSLASKRRFIEPLGPGGTSTTTAWLQKLKGASTLRLPRAP